MLSEVAAAGLLAGSSAGGALRVLAGSTGTVALRRFLQQAAQAQHGASSSLQHAAQQQRQQLACGKAARMLAVYQQRHQQRGWLTRTSSSSATSLASSSLQRSNHSWHLLPTISRALNPLLKDSTSNTGCISSSIRGFCTTTATADDTGPAAAEDAPRRRRRGTTESRAALRRTTESRAAIEDVAVMSRSQLLRRNKPWLAEQCWQHGLAHDGLKEDLIQRLLAWQGTEAGQKAAAAAQAAAAAARAAVAAATAAAAAPITAAPAAAARAAAAPAAAGSNQRVQTKVPPAAASNVQQAAATTAARAAAPSTAAAAAAPGASTAAEPSKLARPAAACAAAVALPAEEPTADDSSTVVPSSSSSSSGAGPNSAAAAAADAQGAQVGWHAPRSAAAAAADSMGLFLGQLQEQPRNAALVAAARNAVEQYTNQFIASAGATQSSSSSSQTDTQQLVSQLAATVASHSSPQSLAALAKACFSREVQNPVLAASLAEAVAAVAAQLGPQEVYGVLRLLVEHLPEAEDPVGFRTLDKGFRVLAEAMIRCSEALKPVQLAEAVELLGVHKYDDAFGLWMIAKEAAACLTEFDPVKEGGSVVQLLNAIAGMCVADDSMSSDVAAAVSARKAEYSEEQLAAIAAALQRMGCTVEL